jgi:short-subunit dehydrogenase
LTRRLVLVTGASSGIGLASAKVFAAQGWDVVVTARRADRLEKLAEEIKLRFGVSAYAIEADLSESTAPAYLQAKILELGRTVDGLVNNAGYGMMGGFLGPDFEHHRAAIQVMQIAPTELVHRFLPQMIEQKFGRILNVASIAGFLPGSPSSTLYGPIKAYLKSFSQGLHLEMRDQGVHVSALCPGWTYTEFMDISGSQALSANTPPWAWMGADEVAREGYMAVEANRPVCVPGAPNKAAVAALKVLPDEWVMEVVSTQLAKLKS